MPKMECRSCRSQDIGPVLSFGDQPLANRLLDAEGLNQDEPTYPLSVVVCRNCRNTTRPCFDTTGWKSNPRPDVVRRRRPESKCVTHRLNVPEAIESKKMLWPSSHQEGESEENSSAKTGSGSPPPAGINHRLEPPRRLREKTMREPSGDHAAARSLSPGLGRVIWIGSPPLTAILKTATEPPRRAE